MRSFVCADETADLRQLDCDLVLAALSEYLKEDASFVPRQDKASRRWFLTVDGQDFEILITGSKFIDTRSGNGGGGAIDLVMHSFRVDFTGAINKLRPIR